MCTSKLSTFFVIDESCYQLPISLQRHLFGMSTKIKYCKYYRYYYCVICYSCAGGKAAFVWDVLHRLCCKFGLDAGAEEKPLIVLIKDAEKALCTSNESCDAFTEAFGRLDTTPRLTQKPTSRLTPARRVILIAAAKFEEPKPKQNNGLRSSSSFSLSPVLPPLGTSISDPL